MNLKISILITVLLLPQFVQAGQAFTILSWNIWFDDQTGASRYPDIIRSIAEEEADMVLLQEVTPIFLRLLQSSKLVKKYHVVVTEPGAHYQNITLSREKVIERKVIRLTSQMDRKALVTVIELADNVPLYVVNVHLESPLEAVGIRVRQLSEIRQYTGKWSHVVIGGDINFGTNSSEDRFMKKKYRDAGGLPYYQERYTYDVNSNHWAKRTKYKEETSRRLDRFYLKLQKSIHINYSILTDKVFGKHKYPQSDHYPIRLELYQENI